jgi:hypothetical protein
MYRVLWLPPPALIVERQRDDAARLPGIAPEGVYSILAALGSVGDRAHEAAAPRGRLGASLGLLYRRGSAGPDMPRLADGGAVLEGVEVHIDGARQSTANCVTRSKSCAVTVSVFRLPSSKSTVTGTASPAMESSVVVRNPMSSSVREYSKPA